jgi:putative PIN family toxin of toxin-antitoxin system
VIWALLRPHSLPAVGLELVALGAEIVASAETLEELHAVLPRAHLDRYRGAGERMEFFEHYRELAAQHEVTAALADCRDPEDNEILSLAVSAQAQIIVASDDDLRVLHPYRSIQIVAPAQFVSMAQVLFRR